MKMFNYKVGLPSINLHQETNFNLKDFCIKHDTVVISTHLVAGLIESYLVELEDKYGARLISHLLAYVTASKYGLTEPEILDILALDTEVCIA